MHKPIVFTAGAIALGVVGYVAFGGAKPSVTPPPAELAQVAGVNIPTLTGDAAIGAKGYAAKCAACHGENGVGVEGAGPPFLHVIYEPSHHGDAAFYAAALTGARAHHWDYGDMPPVQGITKADVAMIIAYIRSLQAANGIL